MYLNNDNNKHNFYTIKSGLHDNRFIDYLRHGLNTNMLDKEK